MSSADDGPGYNVIFYFVISPETSEVLADLANAPPAVRLANEYFRYVSNLVIGVMAVYHLW